MELPCIRCGDCLSACPAQLQPLLIHSALSAGRVDEALNLGILDCSECAACDRICPSGIALAATFTVGKQQAAQRQAELEIADAARQRHRARQIRLVRADDELAEQHSQRKNHASSADAVAAALARARAKKQTQDGQSAE